MTRCTARPVYLSVAPNGIRSTISVVTIRILIGAVFMMLSVRRNMRMKYFAASRRSSLQHPLAECGPMIFIAHEMSQFSDKDVVVFTNCDSVRLSIYDGTKTWTKPVIHAKGHMPNAPVIFENVWDFWEARGYSYTQKNWQK